MLNWSSELSRSASRCAFQVSASLGATLIAALVVQALPRPTAETPPPAPELTSGGKFAARVASARAYDGLDTMPLPHVDALRAEAPVALVPAAFLSQQPVDLAGLAGLGAASRPFAVDASPGRAKAARAARAPARTDARRAGMAPLGGEARDVTPAEPVADADDGLLHQVVSRTRQVWSSTSATTHDAWSATASVGSSLVSRLIP